MMTTKEEGEIKSTNASHRLATVKGQSTFIILLAHYETDAVISFHFIWIFFAFTSPSHFRDYSHSHAKHFILRRSRIELIVVESKVYERPRRSRCCRKLRRWHFWTISSRKIRKCLHNEDYGVFSISSRSRISTLGDCKMSKLSDIVTITFRRRNIVPRSDWQLCKRKKKLCVTTKIDEFSNTAMRLCTNEWKRGNVEKSFQFQFFHLASLSWLILHSNVVFVWTFLLYQMRNIFPSHLDSFFGVINLSNEKL